MSEEQVEIAGLVVLASAGYPLFVGWRAARGTSLGHAAAWFCAGYFALVLTSLEQLRSGYSPRLAYAGFSLHLAALVSVLGARRPGVRAWNFVVVGLVAVFWLALVDPSLGRERWRLGGPHLFFAVAVLAVGVANYLPTGCWPAALAAGVAGALRFGPDVAETPLTAAEHGMASFGYGVSVWLAYYCLSRTGEKADELTRRWLWFRDRFGVFWGVRLQRQFNAAAGHAGLPVRLNWSGAEWTTEPPAGESAAAAASLLASLMRRFASER